MALELGSGSSPTNSGRASPISKKWASQRGAEDPIITKDKAFRRYASSVDRSLSLFDTALQEWADYISFLGRLLKLLQAHPPNVAVIPSKTIVARRLAQCLNPSLPSGVHQKALEVYNYIFFLIGRDALSRDLALYLPGLSSTLSFASLTVRSPFLALLETHLVKLDPRALRPALKSIILGLLPGLEEDTSEDFERTLNVFESFKRAVRQGSDDNVGLMNSSGDEYFWQCFFLASITSHSRRLGALAYLVRNFPKLGAHQRRGSVDSTQNGLYNHEAEDVSDQMTVIVTSPEPGLLLRCFAAGLSDDQLLIQRGFLDLLVTHLPLHAKVLQNRVKSEDLELLLTAASGVVARRDMSLNRRLWAWLLGPDPASGIDSPTSPTRDPINPMNPSRTHYFEEYGLKPLVRAILKMINRDYATPAERAKPFRICLSLMDRWEIGGLVVPEIFLPTIKSVQRYQRQSTNGNDFSELLRSASVFFDGVESGLIWGEVTGLIAGGLETGKLAEALDKMSLVRFIIANFNVREEEMLMIHAPTATLMVLAMVEDLRAKGEKEPTLKPGDVRDTSNLAMSIAMDLIELIPERALLPKPSSDRTPSQSQLWRQWDQENSGLLEKIHKFYVYDQGNLDACPPPFSPWDVRDLLVRKAGSIICCGLKICTTSAGVTVQIKLLVTLLNKSPKTDSLDTQSLLSSIHQCLSAPTQLPFAAFTSIISLVTTLYSLSYVSHENLSGLVEPLVRLAWYYLSASNPKYHVETVRGLWQLQTSLSPSNHEIEAAICKLMTENDVTGTFSSRSSASGRSFSILWTHTLQDNATYVDRRASKSSIGESKVTTRGSGVGAYEVMLGRPLFLLLDTLSDEKTQAFVTTRTWLQNLVGIDKFFYLFVAKLAGFSFLQGAAADHDELDSLATTQKYTEEDDIDQCLFYLQKLSNVLRWSPDATWAALARNVISTNKGNLSLYLITSRDEEITLQEFFVYVCLRAIERTCDSHDSRVKTHSSQLHRTALSVMHQILLSPYSISLSKLHLEHQLIDRLQLSLEGPDPYVQVSLLDVLYAALKLNLGASSNRPSSPSGESKKPSTQDNPQGPKSLLLIEPGEIGSSIPQLPTSLVKCLQAGLSAPSSRLVLDSWINFLSECLPLYREAIFQILIPLVETFCGQIENTFHSLQCIFKDVKGILGNSAAPESTLISLLNGLEHILARGHERLLKDEARIPTIKTPDQPQGFFGNMVSGVFSSDAPQARSLTANNRLTVLLSFRDAVRICFMIWSWGGRGPEGSSQDLESAASFSYTSLRMRNRARRLLEHLFAAEALECLETVIEIWQKESKNTNDMKYTAVFNLLHVLDGSRPKHTIPAIFDAIYSRTNPTALEPSRKPTSTSTLNDVDLVAFLVEYVRSLEDDTMDEIWTDCMTFLRDILANPFPHRQTLPNLLGFAATLGEKVDKTTFGEQKRMRRELGDLFLRLLTATFTTKPMGFSEGAGQAVLEKSPLVDDHSTLRSLNRAEDIVSILASITPSLPKILVENDRVLTAVQTISTSVIGPTFRSKAFPENITKSLLVLLYHITRLPNTQKTWKKDLGDAFNDARFFSNTLSLVESDWLPLLSQWAISDKERILELLTRISPPTTAGIVFGVGATSARLEADRKTQLNLRRIATLVLSAPDDTFVTDLAVLEEKLVELLSATPTSSPSSTTRGEIYMVLRALVLETSPVHLALLWPTINAELNAVISSVVAPDHSQSSDTYNNFSILQACKLLDTLLCIAADDFQLHEWLFITDTIDAVYRPSDYQPVGLIDELSEELGSTTVALVSHIEQITAASGPTDKTVRQLLLGPGGIDCDDVNLERKDELVGKVLRPFFSQLSIFAFERTYEMGVTDWEACKRDLLKDLFDERGIVKAL